MKTLTHTIHTQLSHHAAALAAYSRAYPTFAATLASLTKNLPEAVGVPTVTHSPWLIPTDTETATRRATWLVHELERRRVPEESLARGILAAATKGVTDPKAVVLGIVGVAVIGPTLGLVKKKKKRKSLLRVVIAESRTDETLPKLLSLAQQTALALLSTELHAANGNAYRLEPELADWLFSEHETPLSRLNDIELAHLAQWLKDEQLPHHTHEQDGYITAIAIAPCVSEALSTGTPFVD